MNFRNVMLAMAGSALFAGLAGAQGLILPKMTCALSADPQTIRAGGLTERPGDLTITCFKTSGSTDPSWNMARVNLTVDFHTAITAKADTDNKITITPAAGNNPAVKVTPSEIMLMIDQDRAAGPVDNFGYKAPLGVCSAADAWADWNTEQAAGVINTLASAPLCPARPVDKIGVDGVHYQVLDNFADVAAKNAYQGVIGVNAGNTQVTFYNVPIINSGNDAIYNTYRIVNVRLTAPAAGATVSASVSAVAPTKDGRVLNSFSFEAASPNSQKVADSSVGLDLTNAVSPVSAISSCAKVQVPYTGTGIEPKAAILTFKEGFDGAFKTKVLALGEENAAQGSGALQTVVTGLYNNGALSAFSSESGVVMADLGGIVKPGLANYGTRLRAVFTKLDPKATYYVSTANVNSDYTPAAVSRAVLLADGAASAAGRAASEVQPYATAGNNNVASDDYPSAQPITLHKLVVDADGNAEAVWEVINPAAGVDTLKFAVYVTFDPSTIRPNTDNLASVNLDFAPIPAANSTSVPRFTASNATTSKFANVVLCQTSLLFPWVSTLAKYETGLVIANTSADPYGTVSSEGKCALNFYGNQYELRDGQYQVKGAYDGDAQETESIKAGSYWATLASSVVGANVSGYLIGTCEFQFAHGFAYIMTPTGNTMGYLANVLNSLSGLAGRNKILAGESSGQ